MVATTSDDGTFKVWDIVTGELIVEERVISVNDPNKTGEGLSIAFSFDNKFILVGGGQYGNRYISVYDVEKKQYIKSWKVSDIPSTPRTISIHKNKYYACIGGNNRVFILNYERAVSVIQKEEKDLHLYPNPASGIVNIPVKDFLHKPMKINLFDATGRKLALIFEGIAAAPTIEYKCRKLPAGMYLITLESEGKTLTYKFIKD